MSAGESRNGMKIIVEALGWTEGNWEQCRMIKEKVQQVHQRWTEQQLQHAAVVG